MSPDGSLNPLPEEKLLKLIRGKGPRPAAPAPASAPQAGVAAPTAATSGSGALARRLSALRGFGPQWPRLAMVGLGIVLVLELIALVVQTTRPLPTVQVVPLPAPTSRETAAPPPAAPQMPSVAASVSGPLFASSAVSPVPGDQEPVRRQGPSDAGKQMAQRLTLMGIVAGEPAQAIIEDAQTRKTYFVTKGQAVVEGAILEEVFDSRVVLDLNGEKIELSL